jgi:hypothetical protein
MRTQPCRSRICQDAELRDFIRWAAEHMPQVDIPEACAKKFGAQRAPSLSAVNRYLVEFTTLEERTVSSDLRRVFEGR